MERFRHRAADALRPYKIHRKFQKYPAGSVLIEMGNTKVICAATVEERVPFFLKGTGEGWITAEYSLLPSATGTRTQREAVKCYANFLILKPKWKLAATSDKKKLLIDGGRRLYSQISILRS